MKRKIGFTMLTLASALCLLSGCGGSNDTAAAAVEAPAPAPSPPQPPAPAPPPPTPTPPPPAPPPQIYSATVSWSVPLLNTDGTSLTGVSGYRIYYGPIPTNLVESIFVPGAAVTSQVVGGLVAGTYYFAVATLNSAGVESELSNPASKIVP